MLRAGIVSLQIAVLLALASCRSGSEGPAALLAELAAAVGDSRPVGPRLAGGFLHGDCAAAPVRPSGFEAGCPATREWRPPDPERLAGVGSRIRALAGSSEDPAALHLAGVWHLVWSAQPGATGRALEQLDRAAAAAPTSASLQSDLAAARLVRADREGDPRDLMSALAGAERARAIDPSFPEAL